MFMIVITLLTVLSLSDAWPSDVPGMRWDKWKSRVTPEGEQIPLHHTTEPSNIIRITAPAVIAQDVDGYVDPTFPAFACEERSFIFYAGPSGQPNVFSQNLINEVARRTGASPVIRVGGTSLDHSTYNATQPEAVIFRPGQEGKNVPFGLSFGPEYFDSFRNLNGVKYIVDIPLANKDLKKQHDVDNALSFFYGLWDAIGGENIESIEIGNEPNFYPGADRPRNYGPSDHVQEWKAWTEIVAKEYGVDLQTPTFQAVALASPRHPPIGKWNVQNMFEQGLEAIRSRVASYSIHYYQTVASQFSNLQRDLMNHTAIVQGTRALADTVAYLRTKDPPIPLNIAEFGSALNPRYNDYALESVLGSALWQVDFMLWLLSIGVNRAHIQLGIGFGFAPWQPIIYKGIPAKVNAPYYAHLLVAELIGSSKKMQIRNIDMQSDTLSAYAAYDEGKLSKIAIVNLETWSSFYDDPDSRPSVMLDVEVPFAKKVVEVYRLTSAFGAMASDAISWAGRSWSWESNGLGRPISVVAESLDVRDGHVVVTVRASQAIVLDARYKDLGS